MSLVYDPRRRPSRDAAGSLLSFIVGQDENGRWVALETSGICGGLFRSRQDAMAFAALETECRPDAVRMSMTKIDLFQ